MNEPGRWYTPARRLPQLVGKFPDGTPIPFGPYTLAQVAAVAITGWVLSRTVELWARFGLVGNLLLVVGLVVGVAWLARRAPASGRNPATWLLDAVRLLLGPRGGSLNGRVLRVPRPHRMVHRMVMGLDPVCISGPTPAPVRSVSPAVAPPGPVQKVPAPTEDADCPWLQDPVPAEYGSARRRWLDVTSGRSDGPLSAPLTGVQALLSAAVRTTK